MNEVTRILSEIEPGDPRVADPRLRLDDRRFHWAGAFRMSIVRRHVRQYAWGGGLYEAARADPADAFPGDVGGL
jgi:hypothetical protein